MLSRYSLHATDVTYIVSNYARVAEEFGVHLYATQSVSKAFQHSIRYINVPHLVVETGVYGGVVIYVVNRNQGK